LKSGIWNLELEIPDLVFFQPSVIPHRPQNFISAAKAVLHREQTRSGNLPGFCGDTFRPPLRDDSSGPRSDLMLSPHRPQNREFSASWFEHCGHGNELADSPGPTRVNERLPHRPQNFTPSANRELQFEQATISGIKLEGEPLPRDEDG